MKSLVLFVATVIVHGIFWLVLMSFIGVLSAFTAWDVSYFHSVLGIQEWAGPMRFIFAVAYLVSLIVAQIIVLSPVSDDKEGQCYVKDTD